MAKTVEQHFTEMWNKFHEDNRDLDENRSYYNAQHRPETLGIKVPPEMQKLIGKIGWARTYVDSIEERLSLDGFRMAGQENSDERLNRWWAANNLRIGSSLAHNETLIHGRAFITLSKPDRVAYPTADPSVPRIVPESPYNIVVDRDVTDRHVTRALRLYGPANEVSEQHPGFREFLRATLYLPDRTILRKRDHPNGKWVTTRTIRHNLGVVPVVPILNREKLHDHKGQSEIFPELRNKIDTAARITMNMSAAAELMAIPQRVLFGIANDALEGGDFATQTSTLRAYMAEIMTFEDAEAHATQFNAAELMNFVNVLQELSKQAASDTGLPPQYLSFSSENPASAEAIKSSESRLIKTAERRQEMFGDAWEEVMRIGLLMMDGSIPEDAHRMQAVWDDPATPTYAAKADAVAKLVSTAAPDGTTVIPIEQARRELGYGDEARRKMSEWDQQTQANGLSALYASGRNQNRQTQVV